ncbi:GMC family oxidoreductase [Azospirillum doebereinerae]
MRPTHVIVGGGSAGCAMAARLSEDPRFRVLLIEAGRDFTASATPADLLDTYPGKALANPDYFWPGLRIRRRETDAGGEAPPSESFEQARVIGGGSSINGQVALRGQRRDFDRWAELGCAGWDWKTVETYFRRLETDHDFSDAGHGKSGPIAIKRIARERWDEFSLAVADTWSANGLPEKPDMNGPDGDGISPLPLSNDGERRASAALGYLTDAVRARPNLTIRPQTRALRLRLDGNRVSGVEVQSADGGETVEADHVILCCGALFTPWLLMRSGIGPGAELQAHGIPVALDRRGVGNNLLDHPSITVSAYLTPEARRRPILRHNYLNGVYSSGMEGCPASDMVMSVVCRSAWHPIGQRLGTVSCYVGKAYSRGRVALSRQGPDAYPDICFNWASDPRDMARLIGGFRRVTALFHEPGLARIARNPFASAFSDRVRSINRNSPMNRVMTSIAAQIMDRSDFGRGLLVDKLMAAGVSLAALVVDEARLAEHIRKAAWGLWHPSGTCRMGRADDPDSVVDPGGRLIGMSNLFVADASVFPEIPTFNINIPTIMVAERISDLIKAGA